MADCSPPQARPDVIPLYPGRADAQHAPGPAWARRLAHVVSRLREVHLPAELTTLLREAGRGGLHFLAPALLLSAGLALLALLLGSVAAALGWRAVDAVAVAATVGRWTLLATAGGALAWRGLALARTRWR